MHRPGDVVGEVIALTGGGVDHAFEVVGAAPTIRLAWDVLRAGGTAVVVGLAPHGVEVSLPAIEFLSREVDRRQLLRHRRPGGGAARAWSSSSAPGACSWPTWSRTSSTLDGVADAMDRLRRGEGDRTVIVIDPELAGVTAGGTP